ncbi:MAG: hypothetical protein ACJAYU_003499 [Bradymonadia bacterium]|jgi:hypothetical protein
MKKISVLLLGLAACGGDDANAADLSTDFIDASVQEAEADADDVQPNSDAKPDAESGED